MVNWFLVNKVYAQEAPPKLEDLFTSGIIDSAISVAFPLTLFICLVFIVIGGYMWMASGGDPAKKQKAQGTLTWAIIGTIFVFLIRLILEAILNFLA